MAKPNISEDDLAAGVLSSISTSPLRQNAADAPFSPFAKYMESFKSSGNLNNSSLCNTPVPVSASFPFSTPFPNMDSTAILGDTLGRNGELIRTPWFKKKLTLEDETSFPAFEYENTTVDFYPGLTTLDAIRPYIPSPVVSPVAHQATTTSNRSPPSSPLRPKDALSSPQRPTQNRKKTSENNTKSNKGIIVNNTNSQKKETILHSSSSSSSSSLEVLPSLEKKSTPKIASVKKELKNSIPSSTPKLKKEEDERIPSSSSFLPVKSTSDAAATTKTTPIPTIPKTTTSEVTIGVVDVSSTTITAPKLAGLILQKAPTVTPKFQNSNPETPLMTGKKKNVKRKGLLDTQQEECDVINETASPRSCRCKKSKCLKLYCDCFGSNQFCNGACTCVNCSNDEKAKNKGIREEARSSILEKNPRAFTSKIHRTPEANEELHVHGCRCKRSGCSKKYCECFANGVRCGEHCICTECRNIGTDELVYPSSATSIVRREKSHSISSSSMSGSAKKLKEDEKVSTSFTKKLELSNDETPLKGTNRRPKKAHPHIVPSASFNEFLHKIDATQDASSYEQLSQVSTSLKPAICWGSFGSLPHEITKLILDWLVTEELLVVACVSRGFADIATGPDFWNFELEKEEETSLN